MQSANRVLSAQVSSAQDCIDGQSMEFSSQLQSLDKRISEFDKLMSYEVFKSDEIDKNLQVIQIRELVEEAVSPTVERTIQLTKNIGDMAQLQMKVEKDVENLRKAQEYQ